MKLHKNDIVKNFMVDMWILNLVSDIFSDTLLDPEDLDEILTENYSIEYNDLYNQIVSIIKDKYDGEVSRISDDQLLNEIRNVIWTNH